MFEALKKSRPYIIFCIFLAFVRLLGFSIYINLVNKNTRQVTNEKSKLWGDRMFKAVDSTYELKGQENLPTFNDGKPYIIISNHTSHYDIPAVFSTIPASVRMVGKKELFRIPFFGSSMRKHEFVCIDRSDRQSAIKSLEKAKELMKSGIVIWIAAEGTRTRTGELGEFKKGVFMLAIDAQATIIPMRINGARDILPADTLKFKTGQHVTVNIAPSIETAGMTEANRDDLMARVRQAMENMQNA